MNWIISIFFLFVTISDSQIFIKEFHQLKSEEEEVFFVEKYSKDKAPSVQAYVCAVEMKQAEYTFNPITKLKIFKRNRKKLDSLLSKHPQNIDLHYIRLLLQERTPSILGYNDSIKEDKLFLLTKIETQEVSKELQVYIYNNTSL
jgi:hypothetical protein